MVQDVSKLPYPDGPAKTLPEKTDQAFQKYHDGLIEFDELSNMITFYIIESQDFQELSEIIMMAWSRLDPKINRVSKMMIAALEFYRSDGLTGTMKDEFTEEEVAKLINKIYRRRNTQ